MNTQHTTQHSIGDRVAVVARGVYKSGMAGRTGYIASEPAPGRLIQVDFDTPFRHGDTTIGGGFFYADELDPIEANEDDEF